MIDACPSNRDTDALSSDAARCDADLVRGCEEDQLTDMVNDSAALLTLTDMVNVGAAERPHDVVSSPLGGAGAGVGLGAARVRLDEATPVPRMEPKSLIDGAAENTEIQKQAQQRKTKELTRRD